MLDEELDEEPNKAPKNGMPDMDLKGSGRNAYNGRLRVFRMRVKLDRV